MIRRVKESVPCRGPVTPAESQDEKILRQLAGRLSADPGLSDCLVRPNGREMEARTRVLWTEGLAGDIALLVRGGVAVLHGTVRLRAQREHAEALARAVPGCRAVRNELLAQDEVEAAEIQQSDTDEL